MIKPIETIYNGYKFRSRLEARWAVFFDTLDVKYEYEKEGFDIDGVWYLPDFYLPDYSCWVEIKPDATISEQDDIKIKAFAGATKDKFILISGIPKAGSDEGWLSNEKYYINILSDAGYLIGGNGVGYPTDKELIKEKMVFALARRAKTAELCLLSESASHNLINETTDTGERWPIAYGLSRAYAAAMQAQFGFGALKKHKEVDKPVQYI